MGNACFNQISKLYKSYDPKHEHQKVEFSSYFGALSYPFIIFYIHIIALEYLKSP